MDVAVEHADGTETLEQPECLLAVVGAPAPLRIHRPERDVGKDHYRCTRGKPVHVALEPVKLLRPQAAESACLQVHHVDQPDEVHSAVIETVPSVALGALAVSI